MLVGCRLIKSYEKMVLSQEMFAFKLNIERFKYSVYLKFYLLAGHFYLISLHKNR